MLELKKITLAYQGKTVLKNINLQFERGTVTVLTGLSGSGKSTLIKLINGVVPHFTPAEIKGDILYNGTSLQDLDIPQRSRVIATVFQNPKSQFFTVHSRDELAFGLENRNLPPEEIDTRITRYTKLLNVEDLLDCDLFKLSGGEKQLIAITATACLDQDIYLFDEPSASLDGHYIERLRNTILTLKELGKTILIVEHRLYYLRELMDRLLVLEEGRCHSYDGPEVNEAVLQRHNLRQISAISKSDLGEIRNQPIFDSSPCRNARLACRHYSYAFTRQNKVFDFNLSFEPGVHFILGPNGIGKSTFLNCLCGLKRGFRGKTFYKGCSQRRMANKISLVMQDVNHQLFTESVWDELSLVSGDDVNKKQVLEKMNLADKTQRHPQSLSGGEKQRLSCALALCSDKPVVVMDEPTSGLCKTNMEMLIAAIHTMAQEGKVIIIVTHDYEFIQNCGGHLIEFV